MLGHSTAKEGGGHAFILPAPHPQSADFYFIFNDLQLQIIENIFLTSQNNFKSSSTIQKCQNWCIRFTVGTLHLVSVDIISTCYVYENMWKLFCTLILKNAAGKFEIWFDLILMIYTYKLLKVFPPKHL